MFPNTTSWVCRDLIRFIHLEHQRFRLLDEFYPVESLTIYGEDEEKNVHFLLRVGFKAPTR
jgi:hypothetical protein